MTQRLPGNGTPQQGKRRFIEHFPAKRRARIDAWLLTWFAGMHGLTAAAGIGMVLIGMSSDRSGERRWHLGLPVVVGGVGGIISPTLGGLNLGQAAAHGRAERAGARPRHPGGPDQVRRQLHLNERVGKTSAALSRLLGHTGAKPGKP